MPVTNVTHKINYKEVESSFFLVRNQDIRKGNVKRSGNLDISLFKLALNTAKAFLTKCHSFNSSTAAFAKSYLYTIPCMMDQKDDYWSFIYENYNLLRDFTKSSRSGELGQGFNYCLAKEVLNAVAVYDFKYYIKEKLKISDKCQGETPDYILVYSNGEIGLLESKATSAADPSGFIYSGHSQCENGKLFLENHGITNIRNSYVSAISFGTTSKYIRRRSTIYYADPAYNSSDSPKDITIDKLYEYSKVFLLAENEPAYEKLAAGKPLLTSDFSFVNNNNYILKEWHDVLLDKKIQLGITYDLFQYLCNPFNSNNKAVFETSSGNDYEYFSDGTFIKIE